MEVDCKHWSSCNVKDGGCCAIGKFDGKPTLRNCYSVCRINGEDVSPWGGIKKPTQEDIENAKNKSGGCTSCDKAKRKRSFMELVKGSAGLLKAELGIDAADESTIMNRRSICESCEHYDFGVCLKCNCFCAAKVKVKAQQCPENRWVN